MGQKHASRIIHNNITTLGGLQWMELWNIVGRAAEVIAAWSIVLREEVVGGRGWVGKALSGKQRICENDYFL